MDSFQKEISTINKFSITFDTTTNAAYEPYIAITVHYMSNEWTINEECLTCEYFESPHTIQRTEQKVSDVLENNKIL